MTRAELLALAARCEAAQGADRELDLAIQVGVRRPYAAHNGVPSLWSSCGAYDVPAYTSSLDAAASLVPEGWRVTRMNQSRSGRAWVCEMQGPREHDCVIGGWSATEPFARCAAALRARAAGMEDEG